VPADLLIIIILPSTKLLHTFEQIKSLSIDQHACNGHP
jgi:hypothetical protein